MGVKVNYYNLSQTPAQKSDTPMEISGSRRLQIKDSRGGILNYNGSDKVDFGNKGTFDLHEASYFLFEKVAMLDEHKNKDLTEDDLKKAESLKGKTIDDNKFYKVIDVIVDTVKNITTFVVESKMGSRTKLSFDYETDAEKQQRLTTERKTK